MVQYIGPDKLACYRESCVMKHLDLSIEYSSLSVSIKLDHSSINFNFNLIDNQSTKNDLAFRQNVCVLQQQMSGCVRALRI